MRHRIFPVTLVLLVSGCAAAQSGADALCAGTSEARADHAAALAADGGPQSLVTGAALIGRIDAGCDDL